MHGFQVLEKVLHEAKPMVYKIGYTHCPFTRFFNRKFGYVRDPHQKWEKMVVVYVSDETVGPSFLEAAMIHCHRGPLAAYT